MSDEYELEPLSSLSAEEEAAEIQRRREESEKNRWRSVEQDGFLPIPWTVNKGPLPKSNG
ncbi:MAG: hypothetical protein EOM03_17980 [Clostridia bacterium]|nr:hypothetical protein [Clostridia bacterium]